MRAYAQYLDEDKGLSGLTIKRNKTVVYDFLMEQFGKGPIIFKKITQNKLLKYISSYNHKKHFSKKGIQANVSALRSFLRKRSTKYIPII